MVAIEILGVTAFFGLLIWGLWKADPEATRDAMNAGLTRGASINARDGRSVSASPRWARPPLAPATTPELPRIETSADDPVDQAA